jgi:hypothetical protein
MMKMNSDTAIAKQQQAPLAALDPMQMIQAAYQSAIEHGAGLDVVNSIAAQAREERDYRSREKFNASLLRIQQTIKPILKRGSGEKPGAKYALIEDIDAALNPLLAEERMNLTFEPAISEKPNTIVVTAILAQGAYERRYPLEMPADGMGPKGGQVMTRTHATGSAMTYAKRYLKNFIFDLQFKQKDDDGSAAGGKQPGVLAERDHLTHLENIRNANDAEELRRMYMAAQKAADATGDAKSTITFADAKNKRYRELQAEGRI